MKLCPICEYLLIYDVDAQVYTCPECSEQVPDNEDDDACAIVWSPVNSITYTK